MCKLLIILSFCFTLPILSCQHTQPEESMMDRQFHRADSAIIAGEFGEVHSLLVMENGELVFEKYYNSWHADSLHQLQSATKSIVSILLGIAIKEGFIKNEFELVQKFYSEYEVWDSLKSQMKIVDLLTQRHGLKWKEQPWNDPDNNWRKIYTAGQGDWYKQILETPMECAPGTKFNYSNAAPVLLSGIVQKASHMSIDAFAKKYLFDPLHIVDYRFWNGNGGPQNNGMALLFLKPRDMLKIGQLVSNKGQWNGKKILNEEFVNQATSPIIQNVEPNGVYASYSYGYLWWSDPVYRLSTSREKQQVYLARGAGGQIILVDPARNQIIVITAWNMQQPNKPQSIIDAYLKQKM